MKAKIHFDGASKGNPGPAGYGFVIELDNDRKIEGKGYIGTATNNTAEYYGLIRALETALKAGATEVEIYSDSQLVVRQIRGEYKVKTEHIKELFDKAIYLMSKFSKATIEFIRREHNKEADTLANKAIKEAICNDQA